MLRIDVPGDEYFNDETGEFSYGEGVTLYLEHSLISLALWEAKWKIAYLDNHNLTSEQQMDYIRCMIVRPKEIKEDVLLRIPPEQFEVIRDYIEDSMTATKISNRPRSGRRKVAGPKTITSEVIYSQMCELGIPFECEKWHLNRLLTLIRVRNIEGGPQDKMSRKDIYNENLALNAARRAKLHTHG